jgi:hypothetical protein
MISLHPAWNICTCRFCSQKQLRHGDIDHIHDPEILEQIARDIKPRAYIAGKVSGLDPAAAGRYFSDAKKHVAKHDFHPVSPMDIIPTKTPWLRAMAICIEVMRHCDIVAYMNNSSDSAGATVEIEIAREEGMVVIELEAFK